MNHFMEVTLDELLLSRDNRHQMHVELLKQYPGRTLVSVTMVMPGPVKSNFISLSLADKAEAYFLKLGFTKDDVSRLRERLLEP